MLLRCSYSNSMLFMQPCLSLSSCYRCNYVPVVTRMVLFFSGRGDEKVLNPDHVIPVWQVLKGCIVRNKKQYDVWKSKKVGDTGKENVWLL